MLQNSNYPKHIAIIMDGNGRWAEKQQKQRTYGHENAVSAVKTSINYCLQNQVKYLTLYAFSTENWKRPQTEIEFLMNLIFKFLQSNQEYLVQNKIKLKWLGKEENLTKKHCTTLYETVQLTEQYDDLILSIAFNYGGRDEIVRATKKLILDQKEKNFDIDSINEALFEQYLDTKDIIHPDLLIRTSGEERISNFLIWQIAYTELYFTSICWPDFDEKEIQKAVNAYVKRKRKIGGL